MLRQTKFLLHSVDCNLKKNLGQHFIINESVIRKVLNISSIQSRDCIVEIGIGLGVITNAILSNISKLWAIDLNANFAKHSRFKIAPYVVSPRYLNIVTGNAMKHPLSNYSFGECKVISNLPYNISSPWLSLISNKILPPFSLTLVVQYEIAKKIIASPVCKNFSPISIFIRSIYSIVYEFNINRNCFFPLPKIMSTLVYLRRLTDPFFFQPSIQNIIKHIFTHRRKQLKGICYIFINKNDTLLYNWLLEIKQCMNILFRNRPEEIRFIAWKLLNEINIKRILVCRFQKYLYGSKYQPNFRF